MSLHAVASRPQMLPDRRELLAPPRVRTQQRSRPIDAFESSARRRPAGADPTFGLAPSRDPQAEAQILRSSQPARAGDVSPSAFQQGQTYLQTFQPSTKTWSYTPVDASAVPAGAVVYVNGYNTSGAGAAGSAQQVSQRNGDQPVYVVYNDTPWWHPGAIGDVNDHPATSDYPPVVTLLSILKQTGGDVTLMGHSMGQAIAVDAAYQYGEGGGDLHDTYVYSWGGVANWRNQDHVADLGGHVSNFVHEEIDQVSADGRTVVKQRGDAWAGANSAMYGGNNWAVKTIDAEGHATVKTNDSHTIGIDYWGGASPGKSSGHDYTGQIGNSRGQPLAR